MFAKEDKSYDASVQLNNGLIVDHDEENLTRVESTLANLHVSTENLEMHWNKYYDEDVQPHEGEIMDYLNIVLNKSHPQLRRICITEGWLFRYPAVDDSQPRPTSVKQLIFKQINIEANKLHLLSADFPTLEYLEFDDCDFEWIWDYAKITMPHTVVSTVTIDGNN